MADKPNISKSQHYVPKFYLKGFSQGNNKIHVFSKNNEKTYCANISNVAHENYFYKVPNIATKSKGSELTEEQKKQDVEKILSSLDDQSSKAFSQFLEHIKSSKLKTFPSENGNENISLNLLEIKKNLRSDLSIFFILQNFRTKEHREFIRQFYDNCATKAFHIMSQYENFEEIKKQKINQKDLKITHEDEAINLFHLRSLLDTKHILGLANTLFNRKWVISINNTNIPLFTSDHPLIKYNYKNDRYKGGYSSDEIIIPLSPTHLLSMFNSEFLKGITALDSKNYMIQELKKENVILYNHLQVTNSYNYVFSNTNEFYMMKDYLKTHPESKNPLRSRIK